jgi:hypothetical protein
MNAPSGIFVAVTLSTPLEKSIEPPRMAVLLILTDATSNTDGALATWPDAPNDIPAIRLAIESIRPIFLFSSLLEDRDVQAHRIVETIAVRKPASRRFARG